MRNGVLEQLFGFSSCFILFLSLPPSLLGLGVSKITSRFEDLLERPAELKKAVILTAVVYYGENIHIEIREGKRKVGQSPGETRPRFPFVLPQWSLHRQQQCVTKELSVTNQGKLPEAWCPGILLGISHGGMEFLCD